MNGSEPAWVADAEARLRQRLYRFECPPSQLLGEYAMDLLESEARADVAAHVPECLRCSEEMAVMRRFLATEPEAALAMSERLRRVIATLVPPAQRAPAVVLRGSARDAAHTYRAEHVVVTLAPVRSTSRRPTTIVGLVSGEGPEPVPTEGGEARLVAHDGTSRSAPIDDLGNFELADVPPGQYELEIRLSDRIIALEELRV